MTLDWAKPLGAGARIIVARQWSFLAWCAAGLACLGLSMWAASLVSLHLALTRAQASRADALLVATLMVGLGSPVVCAIFRAVLRPGDSRLAYLRVGEAELITIAVLEPLAGAWTLISVLAMGAGPWRLAVLLAGVAGLTPFTLAAPAVFDRGWRSLAASLRLGVRYFWELLGLNLLTFAAFFLINSAIAIGWRTFMHAWEGDLIGMIEGHKDPVFLVQMALASGVAWLLYGVAAVVALAPSAAAYRWLSPSGEPDQREPRAALAADAQV